MPITILCHCGKRFDVPDTYAGRKGNCTACGAPLAVPVPGIKVEASDEQLREFGGISSGVGPVGAGEAHGGPASVAAGQQADAVRLSAPAGAPTALAAPPGQQQVNIGKKLADYELERKLGDARSTVFMARSSRGPVALKVLPHRIVSTSPTAGKRFLREARALFGLQHENVARCLDAGEELGTYYLAMELVEGRTLSQLRQERGGRLPEREALEYARQATRGLAYLAQSSLVHRNVKPDHVLVTGDGKVKLVGLGLIRESEGDGAALTMKGTIVGTPQYMSPEQARAEDLDVRADLWSLGVTLYELLAGEVPWDDKVVPRILHKLAIEPVPPLQQKNPAVSPATAAVIEKLLQKKKEARYPSAEALLADLEAVLTGQLVGGLPPGVAAGAVPPPRSSSPEGKPAVPAAGAAPDAAVKKLTALVLVLGGLVVLLLIAVLLLAMRGG